MGAADARYYVEGLEGGEVGHRAHRMQFARMLYAIGRARAEERRGGGAPAPRLFRRRLGERRGAREVTRDLPASSDTHDRGARSDTVLGSCGSARWRREVCVCMDGRAPAWLDGPHACGHTFEYVGVVGGSTSRKSTASRSGGAEGQGGTIVGSIEERRAGAACGKAQHVCGSMARGLRRPLPDWKRRACRRATHDDDDALALDGACGA